MVCKLRPAGSPAAGFKCPSCNGALEPRRADSPIPTGLPGGWSGRMHRPSVPVAGLVLSGQSWSSLDLVPCTPGQLTRCLTSSEDAQRGRGPWLMGTRVAHAVAAARVPRTSTPEHLLRGFLGAWLALHSCVHVWRGLGTPECRGLRMHLGQRVQQGEGRHPLMQPTESPNVVS